MKNNNNYELARILILIPIGVFMVAAICMILASMLEFVTDRGVIYSFFAFVGILSIFLAPLPCLMMSIAGTVFALKAAKEGVMHSRKYVVIGIIEIIVYVAVAILACTIFIAGQSV